MANLKLKLKFREPEMTCGPPTFLLQIFQQI